MTDQRRPVVAVSACLLGEKVRYDGGHRLVPGLREDLAEVAEILPVCPEAECGMGVPRESVILTRTRMGTCLVSVDGERDYTKRMTDWIAGKLDVLAALHLCGAILKARSPSCALCTAELLDTEGKLLGNDASGLFTEALSNRFPGLPMMDEEDAGDPDLLLSFLDALSEYCPDLPGS